MLTPGKTDLQKNYQRLYNDKRFDLKDIVINLDYIVFKYTKQKWI